MANLLSETFAFIGYALKGVSFIVVFSLVAVWILLVILITAMLWFLGNDNEE